MRSASFIYICPMVGTPTLRRWRYRVHVDILIAGHRSFLQVLRFCPSCNTLVAQLSAQTIQARVS